MNYFETEYNKFEQLPQLSYNIISYVLNNNENLWKLLKYEESDALDKSNLTYDNKIALIYNGDVENLTDYRVFMDSFNDDAFDKTCSLFRVFPINIIPENRLIGNIDIGIQVMCHNKINQLNNYQTRIITMLQEVIQTLNGKDIGVGLGKIFFDREGNRSNMARLELFNKHFVGYTLIMSIRFG